MFPSPHNHSLVSRIIFILSATSYCIEVVTKKWITASDLRRIRIDKFYVLPRFICFNVILTPYFIKNICLYVYILLKFVLAFLLGIVSAYWLSLREGNELKPWNYNFKWANIWAPSNLTLCFKCQVWIPLEP